LEFLRDATRHLLIDRLGLKAKLDQIAFRHKNFRMEDTIVVAGCPRSGTTWVMDLLNCIPAYTTIFEPLHIGRFPQAKKAGFVPRTYVPVGGEAPAMKQYLEKVFTGRIISSKPNTGYILTINKAMERLKADKLIVKFVRANRLLPWFTQVFSLRAVFLLIRNPYATIASQLRTGYTGYFLPKGHLPDKNTIISDAEAIHLNERIMRGLRSIDREEELLAAIWALDHFIPLTSSPPQPWITLNYETLVTNPGPEIDRIFEHVGESEYACKAIHRFKNPSMTTSREDVEPTININAQLNQWKKLLSGKQIARIQKVLSWFDVTFDSKNWVLRNVGD
jgi:hypothetical protein